MKQPHLKKPSSGFQGTVEMSQFRQVPPSFDENAWIQPAGFENRTVQDLLSEFASVRDSTLALFRHLPQDAVTRTGIASNNPVSVRALGYIIAGHALHHGGVLVERYGLSA